MLILTRRTGESIIVSDNVEIKVLGIRGGQVRIGINAPSSVSVHREEIYRRIQEEGDLRAQTATQNDLMLVESQAE